MTVCRGSCCEEFVLPLSKEMLHRRLQNGEASNGSVRESQLLYDMVVSLPQKPIVKDGKRYFPYTCRFWDKTSRKCSIYSRRPVLCRTFPNGKVCRTQLLNPENGCDMVDGTDHEAAQREFSAAWGCSIQIG